jgi:hypothetical protein
VRQAIDLAIKCVDTGETLVPFITTEGKPGKIVSIVADSADESVAIAQRNIDELDLETTSFAFAYDGYITVDGERSDAIYVEASYRNSDQIFVFAQRYKPRVDDDPASREGNWTYLQQNQPRLKQSRTMRSSECS